MGQFYRKRIPRIIIPFLIWSLLYNLFPTLTGIMGWDNSILSKMFAYAGDNPSQSWENSWHNICMIPFNFNVYTTPLWYIYMLIGLYLYMPFFSAWLHQATDKQIKTFLLIWSLTLFMPYCHEFLSHHTLGTSAWNSFGTLYYFAGFNGYMLLGHYLYRNNNRPTGNTVMLSVILFAIGYAVTYVGFREMTSMPDASEEQVEMFFLYCSPNVLLMTVAVFLLVQKTQIHSPLIVSLLANISRYGLGIYMIHYFIVGIGYLIIERLNIPIALQIPLTGILVFLLSWVIVSFAYRFFPRQAKWIMG